MSQQDAVRSGDDVVRELLHLDQQVKDARKVLLLDSEARPRLLAELNKKFEPLGLKCVPVETVGAACERVCESKGSCKSFSDIQLAPLAELTVEAPVKSPAQVAPLDDVAHVASLAEVVEVAQSVGYGLHGASTDSMPAERVDMSKPVNWKRGDIFTENPRFTLLHLRREWTLKVIDVADADALKGVDVEIQRFEAGDIVQELMTIQQFMNGYVFVRRPQSSAE